MGSLAQSRDGRGGGLHPVDADRLLVAGHRAEADVDEITAFALPAIIYTTTLFAGLYVVQKFAGLSLSRAMGYQRFQP